MKKSLKTRKAPDIQGWSYEMVIHAGKELDQTILKMMNKLLEKKEVPTEWNEMLIKAIDKGTGWLEMKNKSGFFLTNIEQMYGEDNI